MRRLFLLIALSCSLLWSQDRSGLLMGLDFTSTNHTNPYVFVEGTNAYEPEGVKGFKDKTSHFFLPFGYVSYSKAGYGEMTTNAWHLLAVGAYNLMVGNSEYHSPTEGVFHGESYANNFSPVFSDNDFDETFEVSFIDTDLFNFVFSGSMAEYIILPITVGFQGSLGNFGVQFANIRKNSEPGNANNDYVGLVNFNKTVHFTYGLNLGYVTSIINDDLAMVLVKYDKYYFIKGVGKEYQGKGNRLQVELTYFPFGEDSPSLSALGFKATYRKSTVPYMKHFSKVIPTDYSFTKIGFGLHYILF